MARILAAGLELAAAPQRIALACEQRARTAYAITLRALLFAKALF
jgi:hypothetical protein